MLYEVGCAEVGGFEDCDFVAHGSTRQEAKQKLWEHGLSTHGDKLSKLSDGERATVDEKIDQLIRETDR